MTELEQYYNKFNEEKRLLSRHGQVEYHTTMHYVHKYLDVLRQRGIAPTIIDIGAGTGRYSVALADEGYDVTAVELVKYNLGIDDASNVKEAAISEPMMGSQAYSLAVVRVKDAADSEKVAKEMLNGIDPRKWICVEADNLRAMTKGDLVLFFMVDSSFAETVTVDEIEEAFTTVCGGSLDKVLDK